MGGAVKVVVRESDGTVHNMCRWTNNLTWWLHRPEFITNPDKLLKEYIEAKKDSAYYSENDTLSPEGYGLVVIDAVTKTILSYQEYTRLDEIHGGRYFLDFKLHRTFNHKLIDSEIPLIDLTTFRAEVQKTNAAFASCPIALSRDEEQDILTMKMQYELFKMGHVAGSKKWLEILSNSSETDPRRVQAIKNYQVFAERFKEVEERSLADWEYFLRYILNRDENCYDFFEFKSDFTHFDYHGSGSTRRQYNNFKDKLLELGFSFTAADLKDWDEYLKDEEDDFEDEPEE